MIIIINNNGILITYKYKLIWNTNKYMTYFYIHLYKIYNVFELRASNILAFIQVFHIRNLSEQFVVFASCKHNRALEMNAINISNNNNDIILL